ncbi:MAG TPA: arginine--tRNA ligase [Actinomycetota bacterium]|nr:arginine--tRNA ligase [Actinomycetota bacterium]
MIQDRLRELLADALAGLRRDGLLPADAEAPLELSRPARAEHGDFSTNVALALAGKARTSPRVLAGRLLEALPEADWVDRVEIAGPGFINFFLTHTWLQDTIRAVATEREDFGRQALGEGVRVQVEFVSANPTGPLHVGSGRNAAYGDALAALLEAAGFRVEREYYVNDAGRQMDLFVASLDARYRQALGQDTGFPEEGYHGAYMVELGRQLAEGEGDRLVGRTDDLRAWGLARMLERIAATLDRFGVRFDSWFSEQSLFDSGRIAAALEALEQAGHTFTQDGAVWFRSSEFGDQRDRVLVRSDGRTTYLTSDVAYLMNKAERGFDHAIYVWGADHHGAVPSLMAAGAALGLPIAVEVLLYQLVNLTRGGEPVRMSKRTGDIVTLDELIEEVGADAARFTFLLRSLDSTLDFDLDLVKAASQENPVYYAQYAYARICSILRLREEQGIELMPVSTAPLERLTHDSEKDLARLLGEYPETIAVLANLRAPYRLTTFAHEVAAAFHAFYRDCRVIGEDAELTQARLWLAEATRQVLANILGLLGVSAPERM